MNTDRNIAENLPRGVMFNAYPDSIGEKLSDSIAMLERPEFKDVFSLFYILPTFFNSDLDRGFSIVDYNLNEELVSTQDLQSLERLGILLKFDLVLNHLSVGSPQFRDMLKNGDASQFKDFFINWNEFWQGHGEMGPDGHIIPKPEFLEKLFMRKPGLPILNVRFPDGTERPYWNTFYQRVDYHPLSVSDLASIEDIPSQKAEEVVTAVNEGIAQKKSPSSINLEHLGLAGSTQKKILDIVEQKRSYTGQMDLNAKSEKVWDFYEETFKKLKSFGATLIRLDAFAYLHKEPGLVNFFNKPETWNYLSRLRELAKKYDLVLLPEIHSEYGVGLHEEVANAGYPIYDFFFPGLVIHALDRGSSLPLIGWMRETLAKGMITINMLGCHDGIPVLDLKGRGSKSILPDEEIEFIVAQVIDRGGRVKNLFGPDGKKIAYYQVNATFFSALGEDERKLLLARAIQMFMPGIPQVWYLDLFAGKNNYAAADAGGEGGHKEINRTTLTANEIREGLAKPIVLKQLELLRLRNNSPAFKGNLTIHTTPEEELSLLWTNGEVTASLHANLKTQEFRIEHKDPASGTQVIEQNKGIA